MSSARFLVSLIISISFFILAVSAKGHHRQPAPSTTGQPPNRVKNSPGSNVGATPLTRTVQPSNPVKTSPGTNVGGTTMATTALPPPPSQKPVNAPQKHAEVVPTKPMVATKPLVAPSKGNNPAAPKPTSGRGVEAREFLKAHNEVRMKHNQTLFKWDKNLARYARRWALARAVDCTMTHSFGPYGENLFWGKYEHWTPTDAVESWAVEYKDYNAETNECTPHKMCGHYTQIVWQDSSLLGCSRMKCLNGSVVLICEYDPPGNYLGENPFGKVFDNVPLPPPSPPTTSTPPQPPLAAAPPVTMTPSAPSNSSPSLTPPPPPPFP